MPEQITFTHKECSQIESLLFFKSVQKESLFSIKALLIFKIIYVVLLLRNTICRLEEEELLFIEKFYNFDDKTQRVCVQPCRLFLPQMLLHISCKILMIRYMKNLLQCLIYSGSQDHYQGTWKKLQSEYQCLIIRRFQS